METSTPETNTRRALFTDQNQQQQQSASRRRSDVRGILSDHRMLTAANIPPPPPPPRTRAQAELAGNEWPTAADVLNASHHQQRHNIAAGGGRDGNNNSFASTNSSMLMLNDSGLDEEAIQARGQRRTQPIIFSPDVHDTPIRLARARQAVMGGPPSPDKHQGGVQGVANRGRLLLATRTSPRKRLTLTDSPPAQSRSIMTNLGTPSPDAKQKAAAASSSANNINITADELNNSAAVDVATAQAEGLALETELSEELRARRSLFESDNGKKVSPLSPINKRVRRGGGGCANNSSNGNGLDDSPRSAELVRSLRACTHGQLVTLITTLMRQSCDESDKSGSGSGDGNVRRQVATLLNHSKDCDSQSQEKASDAGEEINLKAMDAELDSLRKAVYRSLPGGRVGSSGDHSTSLLNRCKTDSHAYGRALPHLVAFRAALVAHVKRLRSISAFDLLIKYATTVAWPRFRLTPKFDAASHNTWRLRCLQLLSRHLLVALRRVYPVADGDVGDAGRAKVNDVSASKKMECEKLRDRLKTMEKDCEEIAASIHHMNIVIGAI